jgi:hypothetical protein
MCQSGSVTDHLNGNGGADHEHNGSPLKNSFPLIIFPMNLIERGVLALPEMITLTKFSAKTEGRSCGNDARRVKGQMRSARGSFERGLMRCDLLTFFGPSVIGTWLLWGLVLITAF